MLDVTGIVSGKGGVGKTLTTLNLALALQEFNRSVIIVDADVDTANLGLHLGVQSFRANLQQVIKDDADVLQAIYVHPSGLRVIPSSIGLYEEVNLSKLRKVLDKLDGSILVDCPPGVSKPVLSILKACDNVLVVTTPEIPAATDALKVIKISKTMNKRILGLVVNMVKGNKYDLTPSEIEKMCETPILAGISQDHRVRESLFEKTPIVKHNPYSPAAIGFKNLAAQLIGEEYKPPPLSFIRKHF